MKRTTSTLLAGALTAGTAAILTVAAPGIASASCTDGPQVLDQDSFYSTFDSAENDNRSDVPSPTNPGRGTNVTIQEKIAVETDGLHMVNTTNNGKASAYYDVAPRPLQSQTAQSNYAIDQDTTGAEASYQLVVDLDSDGDKDGILVYEAMYGGNWWLSSLDEPMSFYAAAPHEPVSGGPAANGNGTLTQWAASYPEADIIGFGFSLGSYGIGDVTISSLTFGCNTFEFEFRNDAPNAVIFTDNGSDNNYRTQYFNAESSSDLNGDSLTYAWDVDGDGVTDSTESVFLHTYPGGSGTYPVTLTVTDSRGLASAPATTTVTVTQPANTVTDAPLAGTGADVMGLAGIGGLVVVAAGAGLVANRRRKASHSA